MKAVGGYLELELRKGEHYHKNAIKLNTARNCLEYILCAKSYDKIYIPYYTCEALLEPFLKLNRKYIFYNINEYFEPAFLPVLENGEAFLYTNYFGLKQDCVERLANKYGDHLIVDNAQAFYDMPIDGIDTFYSARKFFGVSDGAYLYTDKHIDKSLESEMGQDYSYERMMALLKRIDLTPEQGFQDFQSIESQLSYQPIKKMSKLTDAILRSIDYDLIKRKRRANYKTLYNELFSDNKEKNLHIGENAVPLAYPFQTDSSNIRQELINKQIYCPTYWPNVKHWSIPNSLEILFCEHIIPLPIDQRYDKKHLYKIINYINLAKK